MLNKLNLVLIGFGSLSLLFFGLMVLGYSNVSN